MVAPAAAFYAMPKVALPPGATDEDFVLGLLRATGVLCVYGSGFGARPEDGFFRIVFLAPPEELGIDLRRYRPLHREFRSRAEDASVSTLRRSGRPSTSGRSG